MPTPVSPETAKATRLLLERLQKLSPFANAEDSVEAILLAVPASERQRVLAVLKALKSRKAPEGSSDPLAQAALVVLNAACELWSWPTAEGPDVADMKMCHIAPTRTFS